MVELQEICALVAMTFLLTNVIRVFVPAPQALASAFSGRVWRGPPMESPSRRGWQVAQVDRTAQATAERWVRSRGMPYAGYANSVMNDGLGFYSDISDKSSSNPSLESSRKLYQTFLLYFLMHDHSFIHSHTTHSHTHSYHHSFIPYIQSIAYAN